MRRLTYCFLALTVFAACKKSVKGESKRWERANQTVDELAVQYPGFKSALEEQRSKAKAAMEAAEKISDEEERIDKMSEANKLLTGGFIGQLGDVDKKEKKIRDEIVDAAGLAADEAARMSIQKAVEHAEHTLAEVDAVLKRGAPNKTEAAILLKKVTSDLNAAEKTLKRVTKGAEDKKAEAAEKGDVSGAPAAGEPEGATWTCAYCNTVNAAKRTTCSNCGADRPE
jgi:hypothetical protein